jgi:hypothetical protein
MLRKLAPAFVVTTVALAAGCRSSNDVPPGNPPAPTPTPTPTPLPTDYARTINANPPAPVLKTPPVASTQETRKRKRTTDAGADWGKAATIDWSQIESIDPHDPQGRSIYASYDDHCYVEVPMKTLPPMGLPSGARAIDTQFVDCPPAMDDPAWDTCTSSGLSRSKTKDECYCMPLGGNPPPPPRVNRCPKK